MLCICQLAIAQTKNFQGVVKDAKGNTLPGVTILETGTSMEFQQILTEYLR